MTTSTPQVRTRVAPSPTGDPHIGTAYMALFNLAFAKSQGGQFILRVEDTDQARSTRESEQAIFDALHWLGLNYDEGPDVGGPCGPYRQSERLAIYKEECDKLIAAGHAYRDFSTPEQLDALRKQQTESGANPGYRGEFRISSEEAEKRAAAGEPHVIRLIVPSEGECVINDRLRGEIKFPWAQIDHQVLMKSDGFPTYHLANVVDDHLMGITHVIRGEEWISSAPKHRRLYDCFGWQMPELIHLPLLRNPDKSKLSKRKNPTSINYFKQAGYLPEALLNYLGLIAYSMPDASEMFDLSQMIASFDIGRVSLGGPVFDMAKLAWLNGRWMREKQSADDLLERLKSWMLNDDTWRRILPLVQPRAEKLSDIVPMSAYLFADMPQYDAALLIPKGLDGERVATLIRIILWEFEKMRSWSGEQAKNSLNAIAEKESVKLRDLLAPIFVAISGAPVALPLFETMEIIGADMTRRRLAHALAKLAETGFELKGKKLKKLEEEYQKSYGR
ncbi:glutamate--tRNA ligase [bacterium]|nr:glutamate--tRNA ligase [bacterium]